MCQPFCAPLSFEFRNAYGCGALLVLTDTLKSKMNIALFYQFPHDAIIMSGQFNDAFYHGIPAVDSWPALFSDGRMAILWLS